MALTDLELTAMLKNDWSRPIQHAPNCIDWKNSHPSADQKRVMKNNAAYMRNKREMQQYLPQESKKRKSGAYAHRNSFNEVQKRDLWNFRDKVWHGKSFESVQAQKASIVNNIVDTEEYAMVQKDPQRGYKPTKKLDRDAKREVARKIKVHKGEREIYNRNYTKYPEVCTRLAEGLCGHCTGTYAEQLGCIFTEQIGYAPKCMQPKNGYELK